ncbi:T-cell-specific guanine nucleotide triphosphate-binding protein 2-like [Mercenaria mercenaria]|uniref:T-cell-specific guanine nucleotide triphosphate-binding protein 2-like n=1 Tax=Mercenaria mercenaria TaxID=6596 RepID=UPI001E1D3826|nr:T-cell-specific guanine nucleotide triphosphate-binding protein 2-like [Mercenaria mercenaria]XP_045164579.1 T-cell-specific guanine nucleotide triphosphate-binding protein 2-like [Mercenaria mercenaria]
MDLAKRMEEDVFAMKTLEDDVYFSQNMDSGVFSIKHLDDDVFSIESGADGIIFHNDFSADQADNDDDDDDKIKQDLKLKRQSSTYEDVRSFVQEDKLSKEIEDAGTLHGLNNYINNTVEWWKSKKINVAVTGNSGSGKSSLINAIRGLKPKCCGAAPVGIRETTTEIQKYEFPESDKVVLWDLPGMGTEKFKQETYTDDMGFYKFDIVVVVTANRFLENDIWLAEQALGHGKNVMFVRTKLDSDLANAKRDDPDNFDEIKCIETIRRDIEDHISNRGVADLSEGIYMISSPDRGKYDFPVLVKKLKGLLNIKGVAICRVLQQLLEKEIKAKRDAAKREFTSRKVASALYGFLPVPKLETALNKHAVAKIREICLEKFSLDDDSLAKVSKELDLSVDTLKTYHLSAFNTEQLNHVEKLYCQTEEYRFNTFRRYSKYFVPIVGSILSACKAPHTIQDCVDIICSIMAEDEYYLVQLRLEKLEKQLRPLT